MPGSGEKFSRYPIIFLTNGFVTRIWNAPYYNELPLASVYAKRDLEKEFNKLTIRSPLENVSPRTDIAGRYYQVEAVKAVCHAFGAENRRKALLRSSCVKNGLMKDMSVLQKPPFTNQGTIV